LEPAGVLRPEHPQANEIGGKIFDRAALISILCRQSGKFSGKTSGVKKVSA